MNIPDDLKAAVASDPEILGGNPCVKGTRVPLATFIDHVEAGYSLDEFLKGYSGVERASASLVLH